MYEINLLLRIHRMYVCMYVCVREDGQHCFTYIVRSWDRSWCPYGDGDGDGAGVLIPNL